MKRLNARYLIFAVCLAVLIPVSALAQDVNVRGGAHSGYSRVVFDWPDNVDYTIEKGGETQLDITFSTSAGFNIDADALTRLANIKSIASRNKTSIRIQTHQSFELRDFRVGNRVVVDILNPPDLDEKARARRSDSKSDREENKDGEERSGAKAQQDSHKQESGTKATTGDKTRQDKSQQKERNRNGENQKANKNGRDRQAQSRPEKSETDKTQKQHQKRRGSSTATQQGEPDTPGFEQANVVTVSATQPVDMAAYERAGYLWIVLGKDDVRVPPQISGPQSDMFGDFKKQELEQATAFYIEMPRHAEHLYGEGGGLVWRVVMTPNKRPNIKPVMPERSVDKNRTRGDEIRWPFRRTGRVIEVNDPVVGDRLKVVTVRESDNFTGPKREFVDFITLRSTVGMAVRPKVDDLQVELEKPGGVLITRDGGLALTPESDLAGSEVPKQDNEEEDTVRRIFDFSQWALGAPSALRENERILMNGLVNSNQDALATDLLTLAKLYVSNGRGEEALGYLNHTADIMPEMRDGVEFRALRGVAHALSGKYAEAFDDLSDDNFKDTDEIDLWRSYTLAHLEDWRQAFDVMPDNLDILKEYPRDLRINVGLTVAEIALRGGQTARGASLLDLVRRDKPHMLDSNKAALQYLEGQVARQRDSFEQAKEKLEPLTDSLDDLYRTKAGLSLTNMQLKRERIGLDEAINRLEGIRYGWRGDDLEVNVNYRLGQLYIRSGNYMKGFSTLRRAASLSSVDSDLGTEITDYMRNIFQQIFLGKRADKIEPLQAVSIYEEFSELTPPGKRGDKLIRALAERLVEVDLLGRAADLLSNQVKRRLEGKKAVEVGLRLAGIRLLNKKAEKALSDLDLVQRNLNQVPVAQREPFQKEYQLLKARALSQAGEPDKALDLLNRLDQNAKTRRLRANIAWNAGRWSDAERALADLIRTMNIKDGEALTPEKAEVILNRAVALNLANSRYKLETMRKRYRERMQETKRGRLFDVVTRPRNTGALANRETLQTIVSEVDMFEEFLNAYRSAEDDAG